MFAHKEEVLSRLQAKPACDRRVVRQDLAQPWISALIGAGFVRASKAAFLAEGPLYYLDESAVIPSFDALRSVAAPGSWLGLDAMNPEVLTSPFMATYLKKLAELGCPWKFGVADPDALLASKGWEGHASCAASDTWPATNVSRPGQTHVGLTISPPTSGSFALSRPSHARIARDRRRDRASG